MATTAPKKETKSSVHYSTREEDGKTIITIDDGKKANDVATVKDGILSYADKDARKTYHARVVRYLNDENIGFDADKVKVGEEDDDTEGSSDVDYSEAPKKTIEQGDKTPAYVEWLKKNDPKQYEKTYGIQGKGMVTRRVKGTDPVTGRPTERTYQEEAIIADRKTHLTEKPDNQQPSVNDENQ